MAGSNNPGTWANVHWLRLPAGATPTSAEMNALATFVGSAWGTNVVSKMSNNVLLTSCSLSLYGPSGDLYEGVAAFSLGGANATTVFPAQCAACISWATTRGYRGGHPRSYLPGVCVGMTTTVREFSGTFASSLAAGANTYRTNVNGYSTAPFTSVELGTISFVRDKEWLTPPVFMSYGAAHVDPRIDTQRRRLGRDLP